MSDSQVLVDFAIKLVDFTFYLVDRQVKVLGEIIIFLRKFRQAGKLNFFVPCTNSVFFMILQSCAIIV